jgi:hypothetical protein
MWALLQQAALLLTPLSAGNREASKTADNHHHAPAADGGMWDEAYALAYKAVEDMTTAEKVSPLSGLKVLCMTDTTDLSIPDVGPMAAGQAGFNDPAITTSSSLNGSEPVTLVSSLKAQVNLTTAHFGPCPSQSGGVPRLNITGYCFNDGRKSTLLIVAFQILTTQRRDHDIPTSSRNSLRLSSLRPASIGN